jgi:hypothetical protein
MSLPSQTHICFEMDTDTTEGSSAPLENLVKPDTDGGNGTREAGGVEEDETLNTLKKLREVKDTNNWDDQLLDDIIAHPSLPDENARATVKFYICVRKIYHGDRFVHFMLSQASYNDKDRVKLEKNEYIGLIARTNNMGEADGESYVLDLAIFLQLVVSLVGQMLDRNLIDIDGFDISMLGACMRVIDSHRQVRIDETEFNGHSTPRFVSALFNYHSSLAKYERNLKEDEGEKKEEGKGAEETSDGI